MPSSSSAPTHPLEAEHRALLPANPKGVKLVVDTEGGRRRFALGEPIVLELRFTSSLADAYQLDLGTYDRSGRLWSESFRFEPSEQVADPLADYFGEIRGGLGGIRPMPKILSAEPVAVRVTLNEWARFAGPGTYRFFVQSTRVFVTNEVDGVRTQQELMVTSEGVLELELASDPAWAEKELARVAAVLAKGGDEETVGAARRALRFLGTPAAARAMVDDLCRTPTPGEGYRFQTQAGLYGSPDRAEVLRLLREGIMRPDCAVSTEYLELLTRLEAVAMKTDARAPGALEAVRAKVVEQLIASLSGKSDEARPLSVYTALGAASARGAGAGGADAEKLRSELAKHLGELPDEALAGLLERSWPLVRSAAIAPALLAIVKEARPRGGRMRSISDLALERLVEVDYDGARAFIVAELERGARASFTGATLGLLKDAELPALDAALVRGLRSLETDGVSLELHAEVFARYASGKHVKEAWEAYRAIDYFRVSLLGYLGRHDAKTAEAEIKKLDVDSLRRLSLLAWTPAIEAAVVAKLTRPTDVSQAANLLAERGTSAAEKALGARLDALRGKKTERDAANAIRHALTRGSGWMTPPKRLRELASRCEDAECRRELQFQLERWGDDGAHPVLVLWTTHPDEGVTGWLGHYDLRSARDVETRISQLPEGVTLVWQTKAEDVDPALWANVVKWVAARRGTIVPSPDR
jgi:hypothetical protein